MIEIIQDPIFLKSANLVLLIGLVGGGLFREIRASFTKGPNGQGTLTTGLSAARMILGA
ncbi:MAG TPA: hypothetical protein VNM92_09930 [Thermoanaerobaculia bacterium]|nr:hypothetical protein [Thermoanaerobaculia bacterium]